MTGDEKLIAALRRPPDCHRQHESEQPRPPDPARPSRFRPGFRRTRSSRWRVMGQRKKGTTASSPTPARTSTRRFPNWWCVQVTTRCREIHRPSKRSGASCLNTLRCREKVAKQSTRYCALRPLHLCEARERDGRSSSTMTRAEDFQCPVVPLDRPRKAQPRTADPAIYRLSESPTACCQDIRCPHSPLRLEIGLLR